MDRTANASDDTERVRCLLSKEQFMRLVHLPLAIAVALVRAALEQLPVDFREVIVLREIEGLSYKEMAAVVGVPIGTVMSRLARARERLQTILKLNAPREALR